MDDGLAESALKGLRLKWRRTADVHSIGDGIDAEPLWHQR